MTHDAPPALLSGLRVLDLSQYLPGPYATQLLGDMGAEVLKIEPPQGDPLYAMDRPAVSADSASPLYRAINAGKQVLRLDLKTGAGKAALRGLIGASDLLLESFRPGVMARLGFGHEAVRAINPCLVHVALSGWGYDGPYAERAGHDINYQAVGGLLAASGTSDGAGDDQPGMTYPPVGDVASGMMAALAGLGGLLRAEREGVGSFIDVSIMETVLGWQSWGLTQQQQGQPVRRGQSLLSGGAACYRLYRTADDRWLSVGAIEAKFWAGFCQILGRADWVARQYADPMPQAALIDEVAAVIVTQPLAHWQAVFADADCCVEPVLDWPELARHPQIAARGQVMPATGDIVEVLAGLRVDGRKPPPRMPCRETSLSEIGRLWALDLAGLI